MKAFLAIVIAASALGSTIAEPLGDGADTEGFGISGFAAGCIAHGTMC